MKRRRPISASELMASLSRDPEYLARIRDRDAHIDRMAAEYADEDAMIAREAGRLGYRIETVWDFVNNVPHPFLPRPFVGPYVAAYPLLVRHLRIKHHDRVREGIIRALTVKDGGEQVWSALFEEFEAEQNPDLKWILANALRIAMPYKLRRKHPEIAAVLKRTAPAKP
jgi:hypothetical protein